MEGWTGSTVLAPGDVVFFASHGTWEAAAADSVLPVAGGVTYDGSTWGSGTRALLRAAGDLNVSVVIIQADDPQSPTVVRGFEVDGGGHVTTSIGINWPRASGSLTGAVKRVENCVVHDLFSASAQGDYEYGIVVSSGYGGGLHTSNVEILDCITYNTSRGGINVYSANDDPASTISNVTVRGCDVSASGQDPNYAGSALAVKNHIINALVEYNYIHHADRGAGIGVSSHEPGFRGPENLVIRHNIVADNPFIGVLFNLYGEV